MEKILYRFCAAEPVDWGTNQSIGGVPGALYMKRSVDCCHSAVDWIFTREFGSRLGLRPVDWPSPKSNVHVSMHRSSRLLSQCSRLEIYPRVWQSTVYTVSRLVTPRL